MKAFLAGLWQEGNWTTGQLTGRVDVITPAKGPMQVNTDLQLDEVGLETPSGWLAAAGLKARLKLDYREAGQRQDVDMNLVFVQ